MKILVTGAAGFIGSTASLRLLARGDEVVGLVPESFATTSWGTPSLDLGAGVRAQLVAGGVDDVHVVARCTREDTDFPSYRRDGSAATRFAASAMTFICFT